MSDNSLIAAMPDFVAFMRRDAVVQRHLGGRQLGTLLRGEPLAGRPPEEIWDEPVAQRLKQAVRRALANRGSENFAFAQGGRKYEAEVRAQGRERVVCVIREVSRSDSSAEQDGVRSGAIERREFYDRLRSSVAEASLRERRLALCMIHVDGLTDIGGIIDYTVSQDIVAGLLQRLGAGANGALAPDWHTSRIGDGVFGLIAREFADRMALRDAVADLHRRLSEPVRVGDADFSVRPSIGIAVLGDDGSEPAALLDHAQTAMLEARRAESGGVHFYSDSLKLRSLARLDFQRELREAIATEAFALRYAARCDLELERRTAINAYLRWPHELRRDITPAEFLPVAESTGLALDLSRWALRRLRRDAPALRALGDANLRISFGPLRQHFASDTLLADLSDWLHSGEIAARQLELRLSERVLAGLGSAGRVLRPFHDLGIRLVVDEFGRGHSSLPRLARMPLWGLQVDRGLVTGARKDPVAARAARAALALAQSLGLVSIASGIDAAADLQRWRELGCVEGLGDRFGASLPAGKAIPLQESARRLRR